MKSHLSAVHTGLETPYTPAVPLFSPHPTLPLFYTECQWLLFGEKKKKKGEREGFRETRKQLHNGRVLLGLGVQSEQQLQQAIRVTAEAKVEFHPSLVPALHFSFIV